jgi:hypothetical protein
MNIPNFENIQFVDKNGYLTEQWQNIMQQLITALQSNVSNEGFQIPQQPTTNITMLQSQFAASPNPAAYYGNLLYDSTTNQLKVNLAGTFHVVVTI